MELRSPRVPVGWSSVLGWVASLAATVAAVAEGVDTSQGLKYAALSAVTLLVTNGGRQLQAHGQIKAGSPASEVLSDAEKALAALSVEAHANLEGLPADGVDGQSVPFATAQG